MSGVDPSSVVGEFEGDRVTYDLDELAEGDLITNPIHQLRTWIGDAQGAGVVEPTAMTVSTLDEAGRLSSRTVLIRSFTDRGPVFFTNYTSDKATALAHHPDCAAHLWWGPTQRQVRIEGVAQRIDDAESDAYFATRPRGSQIGAWASPQSQPIASRDELGAYVAEAERRFAHTEQIPRPPFWGGIEIVAHRVEFWQGRPNRLHDRLVCTATASGWTLQRLAP